MRTILLVGAALVAVAGSTLVYAQQRPDDFRRSMPDDSRRGMMSSQDRDAFQDARIAALHAGLRLSAEQEKNWADFERAYRDFAMLRSQRSSQPPPAQTDNPIDRMARRADALTKRGEAMKRLADAASPLYGSLDDAQKRRFAMLSRLAPGPRMYGHGMRRFGLNGPGMDRPDMDRPGADRPGWMGPRGGDQRERFGMNEPRSREFDRERLSPRERFEHWRERSRGPSNRDGDDGAERL